MKYHVMTDTSDTCRCVHHCQKIESAIFETGVYANEKILIVRGVCFVSNCVVEQISYNRC